MPLLSPLSLPLSPLLLDTRNSGTPERAEALLGVDFASNFCRGRKNGEWLLKKKKKRKIKKPCPQFAL
jgi:hypothetical protein